MPLIPDVPGLLRELRERSRMSRATAAARVGLSESALVLYENGKRSPQVRVFERLLEAYGVRSIQQLAALVAAPAEAGGEIRERAATDAPDIVVDHLRALFPGRSADYYRGLASAFAYVADTVDKPKG